MTKRTKYLLVGCVLVFVVFQFCGPARTNPPVIPSHTIQSRLQVPTPVADIMSRACMDCHSHETRWPWYGHVAPVSWWLANDVNDARAELNFSEWSPYPTPTVIATLGAIDQVVKQHLMPPASYQKLHPAAVLSEADAKAFCDWAQMARTNVQNAVFAKR